MPSQTYVLYVRDEEVAVLRSSHSRGVDVLHHETKQVLVPLEDEVPQVALEEILCPVEEGARGLD